eukprot:1156724-Rhodomonas_salina.1
MSTQDFVKALALRPEPFQLETVELLIDSDRRGGIPTAHEYFADGYLALERQGAQLAEASTAPAGRRRPRKGIPKRSPFDDDSWNDERAGADYFRCTPSDDGSYAEATAISALLS